MSRVDKVLLTLLATVTVYVTFQFGYHVVKGLNSLEHCEETCSPYMGNMIRSDSALDRVCHCKTESGWRKVEEDD